MSEQLTKDQVYSLLQNTIDRRKSADLQIASLSEKFSLLENEKQDNINYVLDTKASLLESMDNIVDKYPNVKELETYSLAKQINRAEYANIDQSKANDLSSIDNRLNEQLDTVDKLKRDVSTDKEQMKTSLESLQKTKNELNKTNVNWDELSAMNIVDKTSKRAEDMPEFNIHIMFNGKTHKVLQKVDLTSHQMAIPQGGEAIKEVYTFVAQTIK